MAPNQNKGHLEASGDEKSRVVFQALRMALGTTTSRVLGLVRDIAFSALFDRALTDAWIAAFKLPNLFRRLLGEGSLSASFVPIFVEARMKDPSGEKAKALVNSFFTLLMSVLATITVLGIVFMPEVLRVLLDPVYVAQSEKFALTVRMGQIMFGFVFLVCSYAYFMGILNALGRYGLPAMAPTLFNVAMIISTLLPPAWFPFPGDGLAWGVLIGGVLQAGLLIPTLWRLGYWPRLSWAWGQPEVLKVLRNMAPGLAGLGLLQVTTLVNMRFASQLGEGPISWINWADRLLELPLSLISVSLGTALLPTLAAHWSRGEREQMASTTNFYLRLNVFLCWAAALGLFGLAEPIVRLLFERGRFSPEDTLMTASVVRIWALIMIPTACVRVLAPAYYAVQNTWLPAVVSGVSLLVHVLVAPGLMGIWGLTGLNLSSLLAASLNFFFLFALYGVFIARFQVGLFAVSLLKFLVPGAALFAMLQVHPWLEQWWGRSFLAQIFSLGITIGLGFVAFALVSRWMKLEEWEAGMGRVLVRVRSRLF